MALPLNTVVAEARHDAPNLLIAHGLYGSARNWGVIAKRLSDTYRVTAVDMRNHGESPWSDTHTYADMADDLSVTLDQRSHVVGHSMGGKAAMVLDLTHPEKVERLVVADVPEPFQGAAIGMITAGLASLAFMGFAGLVG